VNNNNNPSLRKRLCSETLERESVVSKQGRSDNKQTASGISSHTFHFDDYVSKEQDKADKNKNVSFENFYSSSDLSSFAVPVHSVTTDTQITLHPLHVCRIISQIVYNDNYI